eukprot:gene19337-biopygen16041
MSAGSVREVCGKNAVKNVREGDIPHLPEKRTSVVREHLRDVPRGVTNHCVHTAQGDVHAWHGWHVRIGNLQFARRTGGGLSLPARGPDPGLGQGQPSGGADNIWLARFVRRLDRVIPNICRD